MGKAPDSPDGYWEEHPRQIGLVYSGAEEYFFLYFGAQTHDSSDTKVRLYQFPWQRRQHLSWVWLDKDGNKWLGVCSADSTSEAEKQAEHLAPAEEYAILDSDMERLFATIRRKIGTWRTPFPWCCLLKDEVHTYGEIEYSRPQGPKKNTWKGGTLSAHIILPPDLPNTHEAAMTYIAEKENFAIVSKVTL
jgi:hypothetical protein